MPKWHCANTISGPQNGTVLIKLLRHAYLRQKWNCDNDQYTLRNHLTNHREAHNEIVRAMSSS